MPARTAAVLVLAAAVFVAAPASADGPYSFTSGGGDTVTLEHFSFTAHDGPQGPSGHVVYKAMGGTFGGFEVSGHVQCLIVSGNNAVIGITIEKGAFTTNPNPPFDPEGRSFYLNVRDNGEPGSSPPDLLSNSAFLASAINCASRAGVIPVKAVVGGNIFVDS